MQLFSRQVPHFHRLIEILDRSQGAIDTSPTGSGKSFVATMVALHFGMKMFVVCPTSVKHSWKEVAQKTGIEIVSCLSYETLRGQKQAAQKAKGKLNHPYLTRADVDGETTFSSTKALRELIDDRTLFVFDEVQKIKNLSDQTRAVRAILNTMMFEESGQSRFMLLSGSPFDKAEHAVNLFRTLGFIRHRNLYTVDPNTHDIVLRGMQELIEMCEQLNPEKTREMVAATVLIKSTMVPFCFDLFCEVVKPYMGSEMPGPDLQLVRDIKDGYYVSANPEVLLDAVAALSGATRYKEDSAQVDDRNFGLITSALQRIEVAKRDIFSRLARKRLQEDPHAQVIVFLNYNETITGVSEDLKDLKPLILTGSCTGTKRGDIIDAFQAGTSRLLITNTRVGGVGLNLQDLHGGRKRYVFGSPTYSAIDIHQAVGRVYRYGAKSDSEVRWVYGQVGAQESSIINALARKRAVLERVLHEQTERGEEFPGGYEKVVLSLEDE